MPLHRVSAISSAVQGKCFNHEWMKKRRVRRVRRGCDDFSNLMFSRACWIIKECLNRLTSTRSPTSCPEWPGERMCKCNAVISKAFFFFFLNNSTFWFESPAAWMFAPICTVHCRKTLDFWREAAKWQADFWSGWRCKSYQVFKCAVWLILIFSLVVVFLS